MERQDGSEPTGSIVPEEPVRGHRDDGAPAAARDADAAAIAATLDELNEAGAPEAFPPRGIGPLQRREIRLAYALLIPTFLIVLGIVPGLLLANFWISMKPVELADLRPSRVLVNERLRPRTFERAGETGIIQYRIRNSSQDRSVRNAAFTDTVPPGLVAEAGGELHNRHRARKGGERDVTGLPPSERGLSIMFQSYALYPHMTVRENVGFGLKTMGAPKPEIERRVAEASRVLELDDSLDRRPEVLSGGQRQRMAIGRAIVREPVGFLFDEPLSNLDAALRVEMRHEIAGLHKRLAATMIYVTHDQLEAMTLADRIVVLSAGRVMQVGTPRELYERPANLFVAQFIGSPKMNVVPASSLPSMATPETTRIGVRPEHIEVAAPGEGDLDGRINLVEYLGADTFAQVDCGAAGTLVARAPGSGSLREDASIGLRFDPAAVHRFARDGRALAV